MHAVRAVLPHFRDRRGGTLLVVGSLAGIVAPPGEAFYAASKQALRGWMEALHHEVGRFGIRVHLVEPGFIRTNLAQATPAQPGVIADYAALRAHLATHWRKAIASGKEPEQVAWQILRLVNAPTGPLRLRIGSDARWIPRFRAVLPAPLFYAITRRKLGISW